MQFRHLLAGLGALFLLSGAAHAQPSGVSQKVGVCDVKTPTNCIKPNSDGSINVSGSISAGTTATASANPTPVVAGTGKPLNIGLFSNLFMTPVTPTGTQVDLSAPSGILGADGATIMSAANPLNVINGTQTDTVMIGGVNVKEINGVAPLMGAGNTGTGSPRVTIATDQASVSTRIDQTTPGTTNGVQIVPGTTGGLSVSVIEPGASDNHAVIKNGAGQVYGVHVWNNSATINYGRLYNAATGFNGCNSATNLAYEFHIPASTSDAGFVVEMPSGIAFSTGISICITGAYGQTSTTSATASAISLNVLYK